MTDTDSSTFEALVRQKDPEITDEAIRRLVLYRELVVEENEKQNLTRLLSPKEFFEGHFLDAWELVRTGLVDYPAMDLGAGAGVPGIVAAILGSKPWIVVDSEARKAEFLQKAVDVLKIGNVSVYSGRGEDYLKSSRVESIVVRAVGPVERIYGWIRKCSTWNILVLLKGPKWDEEWGSFKKSGPGKALEIVSKHEYEVGAEQKKRFIVKCRRVVG
jgi:16S rRNA (guanine527-N7)-methyltransferase